MFRSKRSRSLIFIVALAVLIVGGVVIFFTGPWQRSCACQRNIPYWHLNHDQLMVQANQEIFVIKYVSISPRTFLIFYALQAPAHSGAPRVSATSLPSAAVSTGRPLTTSVQSLRQIGTINLGVIHIRHFDQVGQVISLMLTLPGMPTFTTTLKPLHQQVPENNSSFTFFLSGDREGLSPVTFEGLDGGTDGDRYGFFTTRMPDQELSDSLFFRVNDSGVVALISEQEYVAKNGSRELTPTTTP